MDAQAHDALCRGIWLVTLSLLCATLSVTPALARPTDGADDPLGDGYAHPKQDRSDCFARQLSRSASRSVCVHWVPTGVDAPPGGKAKVPLQVRLTVTALKQVWDAEVDRLGYKPPLRDDGRRTHGPNRGLDVYLADIGRFGMNGYCTRDRDPDKPLPPALRAPVYCVVDNDFAANQFSGQAGNAELELTLAHEFFHAIQLGYDATSQASWLKEGTAVWMEGQVFPAQFGGPAGYDFLASSALAEPEEALDALDATDDGEDNEYGSWLFWQFLGEYYGSPEIVHRVWARLGRHRTGETPFTALTQETVAGPAPGRCISTCAPVDFPEVFAEWETWNTLYPLAYAAGPMFATQLPASAPPVDDVVVLDSTHQTSGLRGLSVTHLSVRSVAIESELGGPVTTHVDVPDDGDAIAVLIPSAGSPSVLRADGSLVLSAGQTGRLLLVNAARFDARDYRYEVTSP